MDKPVTLIIIILVLCGFFLSKGIDLYQENQALIKEIQDLRERESQGQTNLESCRVELGQAKEEATQATNERNTAQDELAKSTTALATCQNTAEAAQAHAIDLDQKSQQTQAFLDTCKVDLGNAQEVIASRDDQAAALQICQAALAAQPSAQPASQTAEILIHTGTAAGTLEEHVETIATGALGLIATLLTGMLSSAAKKRSNK